MCGGRTRQVILVIAGVCSLHALVDAQEPSSTVTAEEVQSLAVGLRSKDWETRTAALTALEKWVDGSQKEARSAFSPVIEPLLAKVGYGGIARHNSETALRLLVKIGQPAVPSLLLALKSPEGRLRRSAVEILIRRRPDGIRLVETVGPLLSDPDDFVRSATVQGLGRLGAEAQDAVPLLKQRLTTEVHPGIVLSCHEVLARIETENPVHIANIAGFLAHDKQDLRGIAASMLGRFGTRAIDFGPALLACLNDKNSQCRITAAHALGEIGYGADDAITALIDIVKNDEARETRRSAAGALGTFGPKAKRAVPALVAVMDADAGWWIAVDAIAKIDGIDALPILIKLVDHPDADIRLTSVRHLGGLGPAAKESLPVLRQRLGDERSYIGKAAAKAIQQIEATVTTP